MKIHFTKMHGLGNDFILIDCMRKDLEVTPPQSLPCQEGVMGGYGSELGELSRQLCDRRFGVGADQMLLLYPSNVADFKMRIVNADGSEVEMCGNGIRCLAHYIWERGLSEKNILEIETLAGIIKPERAGDMVKVDMGEPVFQSERIPVNVDPSIIPHPSSIVVDYPLQIENREFKITCVSMGNPHAIIIVENVSEFPVTHYGPLIEKHPLFPKRINVEFIEILSENEIKMRVWERGAGETMACGTGASAVAVASHIKGLASRTVTIHLDGGDLFIEWARNNHVFMTGPAVRVFEGIIEYFGQK